MITKNRREFLPFDYNGNEINKFLSQNVSFNYEPEIIL